MVGTTKTIELSATGAKINAESTPSSTLYGPQEANDISGTRGALQTVQHNDAGRTRCRRYFVHVEKISIRCLPLLPTYRHRRDWPTLRSPHGLSMLTTTPPCWNKKDQSSKQVTIALCHDKNASDDGSWLGVIVALRGGGGDGTILELLEVP